MVMRHGVQATDHFFHFLPSENTFFKGTTVDFELIFKNLNVPKISSKSYPDYATPINSVIDEYENCESL